MRLNSVDSSASFSNLSIITSIIMDSTLSNKIFEADFFYSFMVGLTLARENLTVCPYPTSDSI